MGINHATDELSAFKFELYFPKLGICGLFATSLVSINP